MISTSLTHCFYLGEFPLSLYGSPHDVMLATCNDSVAMLKMGKLAPKEQLPTTHNTPLCGALYNELFHQVNCFFFIQFVLYDNCCFFLKCQFFRKVKNVVVVLFYINPFGECGRGKSPSRLKHIP